MPISEEIYRAEQNYMPFLGPGFTEKIFKAQKHIKIMQRYAPGFPENTLTDGPAF